MTIDKDKLIKAILNNELCAIRPPSFITDKIPSIIVVGFKGIDYGMSYMLDSNLKRKGDTKKVTKMIEEWLGIPFNNKALTDLNSSQESFKRCEPLRDMMIELEGNNE